jgi:hypothetical protein
LKARQRLEQLGFLSFPDDESCFIHGTKQLIITLYVNDIQYFGQSLDEILDIEKQMAETFNMTNQGEINYYLDIKIEYNKEKGVCHLNQARYIE